MKSRPGESGAISPRAAARSMMRRAASANGGGAACRSASVTRRGLPFQRRYNVAVLARVAAAICCIVNRS